MLDLITRTFTQQAPPTCFKLHSLPAYTTTDEIEREELRDEADKADELALPRHNLPRDRRRRESSQCRRRQSTPEPNR